MYFPKMDMRPTRALQKQQVSRRGNLQRRPNPRRSETRVQSTPRIRFEALQTKSATRDPQGLLLDACKASLRSWEISENQEETHSTTKCRAQARFHAAFMVFFWLVMTKRTFLGFLLLGSFWQAFLFVVWLYEHVPVVLRATSVFVVVFVPLL